MTTGELGKVYEKGQIIVRQGDTDNCMYVIQEGEVEVIRETGDVPVRLATLEEGDFFGEMAIFERQTRSATVRALSKTRLLTIDKKTFLSRIQQDPVLAFRIVETMSSRIRSLGEELAELKTATRNS